MAATDISLTVVRSMSRAGKGFSSERVTRAPGSGPAAASRGSPRLACRRLVACGRTAHAERAVGLLRRGPALRSGRSRRRRLTVASAVTKQPAAGDTFGGKADASQRADCQNLADNLSILAIARSFKFKTTKAKDNNNNGDSN